MATSHDVTLTLQTTQTRLDLWDRYDFAQDILRPGNPWTFTLWHSDEREAAWSRILGETQLGARVVVAVDGAPQLNGRIELRSVVKARQRGVALVITGRDLAGPAIDWDADPGLSLNGKPLEEVLEALFKPLGIAVVIGAGADAAREVQSRRRPGARDVSATKSVRRKTVDMTHPRPGERFWQVAESIVRKLGYMLWVAPSANGELAVVVDTPNYEQQARYRFSSRVRDAVVTPDSNVLESDYVAQIRDIPTVVYAMGRAARGDRLAARHRVAVRNARLFDVDPLGLNGFIGGARDPVAPISQTSNPPGATADTAGSTITTRLPYANRDLQRFPLVISPLPPQPRYLHTSRARDPRTGQQEAAHEMARAMANFRVYRCTVQGHGQDVDDTPTLYAVNTMASVYDRFAELDEEMLITRVEFAGGRGEGQLTKLTLGQKGAIDLAAEADA